MEKERQEEAHNFQNDNQNSSFAWILPISFFLHKILIYPHLINKRIMLIKILQEFKSLSVSKRLWSL